MSINLTFMGPSWTSSLLSQRVLKTYPFPVFNLTMLNLMLSPTLIVGRSGSLTTAWKATEKDSEMYNRINRLNHVGVCNKCNVWCPSVDNMDNNNQCSSSEQLLL